MEFLSLNNISRSLLSLLFRIYLDFYTLETSVENRENYKAAINM